MIIIVANPSPWSGRSNPGARLRWDAVDAATGDILATATEYPLSDAAMALADREWPVTDRIVMRHAGSETDVFRPMTIWSAALPSNRRFLSGAKYARSVRTSQILGGISGFSDPAHTNEPGGGFLEAAE